MPFSFQTLLQKAARGRSPETKAGFRHPRASARLADLGPGRPGPCGQYLNPPRPRWRVSAVLAKPGGDERVARALGALGHATAFLPARPQIAPHSACRVASLGAGSTVNAIAVGRSSHPRLDRRRQRRAWVFLCILLPVTQKTMYWSKANSSFLSVHLSSVCFAFL